MGPIIAEILGGTGLILLGCTLAASGLGDALGAMLRRRFADWTRSAPRAFATGVGLSTALGGVGSLPASVASLGRRWNLSMDRAAMLLAGTAFSCILVAGVAWADGYGTLVREIGLTALCIGGLARIARPTWTSLGDGVAGHGLLLVGMSFLGSAFRDLGADFRMAGAPGDVLPMMMYAVGGLGVALLLRSPCTTTALVVQAVAGGALDVHMGAACLVGIGVSLPWYTALNAIRGDVEDGVVAAAHVGFTVCLSLFGMALLGWCNASPSILHGIPGGPHAALALFLVAAAVPATLVTLIAASPLELLARGRLAAGPAAHRSPAMVEPRLQLVPSVAVEALSSNLEASVTEIRDVARHQLGGSELSAGRWNRASAVVSRTNEVVAAFCNGLDVVRWPGCAVAETVRAASCARLCHELLEEMIRVDAGTSIPHETVKVEYLRARLAVLRFVEACAGIDGPGSLEALQPEGELLDMRLVDLYQWLVVSYTVPGSAPSVPAPLSDGVARMRGLVKLGIQVAETRPHTVAIREPHSPSDDEAIDAHTGVDVEEPPAPHPAPAHETSRQWTA